MMKGSAQVNGSFVHNGQGMIDSALLSSSMRNNTTLKTQPKFSVSNSEPLVEEDSDNEVSDLRELYEINAEQHEYIEKQKECITKMRQLIAELKDEIKYAKEDILNKDTEILKLKNSKAAKEKAHNDLREKYPKALDGVSQEYKDELDSTLAELE